MLSSLKNIFKVPDLRNKVVFTLLIIGLYQLGANLIVPFISIQQIQLLEAKAKSGRHPRLPEPVLRGRAAAHGAVRARDHAVHHQFDHHPAPLDRDPQARGVA